jgi:pimeloyl-ACP methyl ester carboxylesterase
VVAIDRPGSGHSERPRRWHYGPIEQARLVRSAMKALGIDRPIVVGHSWGALVAAALALEHPGAVRSLVLASGLYFPSPRLDIALYAPPALPLLGALLRRTVSPLASRALLPAWKRTIFAPAPVPAHFEAFPAWLASRPSQLLAVGEEALLTLPAILRLMPRYRRLDLPVVFVAGRGDRYVSARAHTQRLHAMLPTSRLLLSGRAGHMVHHSDLPLVLEAIDQAAWPTA